MAIEFWDGKKVLEMDGADSSDFNITELHTLKA